MCVGIIHVSRACCPYQTFHPHWLNYGVREDTVLLECDAMP